MFDKCEKSIVNTDGMTGLINETTVYLQHKHDLLNELADNIIAGPTYSIRLDHKVTTRPISSEKVCETRLKADICPGVSANCITVSNLPWPTGSNTSKKTFFPKWKTVIFNAPATVIMWDDGTKTVVKLMEGEEFNPEVGLAMCFCKKVMGDGYKRWFKDALKKGRWQ